MRIISKGGTRLITRTVLSYKWNDDPDAGFSFNCDSKGNIDVSKLNPSQRYNFEKCRSGEFDVTCEGVETETSTSREAPVGECTCGRLVALCVTTNDCECGLSYNPWGQLLTTTSGEDW